MENNGFYMLNSKNSEYIPEAPKRSLAIMSVYDADGIIDTDVIYFLDALGKVADRIVVAVNGTVSTEGKGMLQNVVDDVYIRPNKGFDFGAYKDTLLNYLPDTVWNDYQEIILCNDTCFGPFTLFETIFETMYKRNLEFWSISFRDNILVPYYESFFMVFGGRALVLLRLFLSETVDSGIIDMFRAQGYEHYLSESVMQQGILAGSYTSGYENCPNLDIYRSPDYAMEVLGLPLMKKKCFCPEMMERENCYAALAWIGRRTDYPLEYIFRSVRRRYGLDIRMQDIEKTHHSLPHEFWRVRVSREEVISFCREHEKVYLFGRGYMSVFIMARFRRYMNEFGGYIVSDECYSEEMEADQMVLPLSSVDKDAPVIVALLEDRTREVMGKLEDRGSVLWLSVCS